MSSLREEAKMAANTMSANLAGSKAKGEEGGGRSVLIVDAQMNQINNSSEIKGM